MFVLANISSSPITFSGLILSKLIIILMASIKQLNLILRTVNLTFSKYIIAYITKIIKVYGQIFISYSEV